MWTLVKKKKTLSFQLNELLDEVTKTSSTEILHSQASMRFSSLPGQGPSATPQLCSVVPGVENIKSNEPFPGGIFIKKKKKIHPPMS